MQTYLKPIKDSLFLEIDQALIDEISTESGFKLYLAPEYNFEQNVCVTAKIIDLPRNCSKDLSIGDEIAFSYRVISERTFPNTADFFVEISEGSPHIRIWQNKKGERLRMLARPGVISLIWTGTYFDKYGRFQYGCQGTESEVGRWLSQFKFGDTEGFTYKNQIHYSGKEYWKCPLNDVFAKKVGDEIVSVSDRVICEYIDVPVPDQIKRISGIDLADTSIQMRYYDRATVVSGGESLGISKGDIVSFEEKYCEKYTLFGKEYFLIKTSRINGTWQGQ